jgi:hypothetical protein
MTMLHPSLATGRAALSTRQFVAVTGGEEGFSLSKEEGFDPSPAHPGGSSRIQNVNAYRFQDAAAYLVDRHLYFRDHSEEHSSREEKQ